LFICSSARLHAASRSVVMAVLQHYPQPSAIGCQSSAAAAADAHARTEHTRTHVQMHTLARQRQRQQAAATAAAAAAEAASLARLVARELIEAAEDDARAAFGEPAAAMPPVGRSENGVAVRQSASRRPPAGYIGACVGARARARVIG
jgi:hypothetical protein